MTTWAEMSVSSHVAGTKLVKAIQSTSRRCLNIVAKSDPPPTAHLESGDDGPLDAVRIQHAAVLFADIVAFTRISEDLEPARVIAFLRQYHTRMGDVVYRHGGQVNDYVGDTIMAVFSAPDQGRHEATNALACAFGMMEAIDVWNTEPDIGSASPIRIGIGIHFGVVVMGVTGVERHQEHAVVGDTVNVARKLESLTRKFRTSLIISEEVAGAATRRACDCYLVAGMTAFGRRQLPGREKSISILGLDRSSTAWSASASQSWGLQSPRPQLDL